MAFSLIWKWKNPYNILLNQGASISCTVLIEICNLFPSSHVKITIEWRYTRKWQENQLYNTLRIFGWRIISNGHVLFYFPKIWFPIPKISYSWRISFFQNPKFAMRCTMDYFTTSFMAILLTLRVPIMAVATVKKLSIR